MSNEVLSQDLMNDIISKMIMAEGSELSANQLKSLKNSLQETLAQYDITTNLDKADIISAQEENAAVLRDFINAKRIEGRSNSTLYNYGKEDRKSVV